MPRITGIMASICIIPVTTHSTVTLLTQTTTMEFIKAIPAKMTFMTTFSTIVETTIFMILSTVGIP